MILILRKTMAVAMALMMMPAWPLGAADAVTTVDVSPKAAVAPSGAASMDGIVVGPDLVKIQMNRPVKFNSFTTANPPRVIVEVLGANVNLDSKVLSGQGANLKRVRAGQFQGEPDPIARIVLDLKKLVRYSVAPDGNFIVVKLEGFTDAPASVPAAVESPTVLPVPSGAVQTGETLVPVAAVAVEGAAIPAPQDRPIIRKKKDVESLHEVSSMGTQSSAAAPVKAEDRISEKLSPYKAESVAQQSIRDIIATLPKDNVSLDLQDTDIGDVLKLMAAKAGTNIIFGPDVAGTVSLHLNNVPFSEAFSVVLGMKGLMIFQAGDNTLRVLTSKQLQKERQDVVGVTQVFKIYYQDAGDIKKEVDAVRTLEKRQGQSVIDMKNNALIVTDSPDGLSAVERLISQLDVRPQQVMIETKLVEVDLNKDFELGVQWDYFSMDPSKINGQSGTNYIGGNPSLPSNPITTPLTGNTLNLPTPAGIGALGRGTGVNLPGSGASAGAFTFGRITSNYLLSATLTAAVSKGKLKILSDPKVATLNNKSATINLSSSIPYITNNISATGAQTAQVANTTVGIILTVTPQINTDGRITLHVVPNISKISATTTSANVASSGAIATDNRQIDTNILVRNGETIVLGGLITDSLKDNETKVPFFGDLPLLGWLFRNKSVVRSRTELLIFVTTKLLAD